MASAPPRSLLVLLAVLAVVVATPRDAVAAGTMARSGATLTIDTGPGTSDGVIVQATASAIRFLVHMETSVTMGSSGCTFSSPVVTCAFAADIDRVIVVTNDKFDAVVVQAPGGSFTAVPAVVDAQLGAAGDSLVATAQPEPVVADGGDGDDLITTGPANDVLDGGAGADLLTGGLGRDELGGGSGVDVARYEDRSQPLAVSLDGQGNDGEPGLEERDNVHADVERVNGGTAGDTLTGGPAADDLRGLGGGDLIQGGDGVDVLYGGTGGDRLEARDGLAERVSCGDGIDTAIVDDIDTPTGCETVESSPELQPDRDVDGIDAPVDCNDTNATVRPGAFDVPGDGIDQDCLGGDAVNLDPDLDGFPNDQDCGDTDPAIRPGGLEINGNAVDEDCNGTVEPYPAFEARVRLSSLASIDRGFTLVTGVLVTALGPDDRVVLRCTGRGCPFSSRRPRPPAGGGLLSLGRPFAGAKLRPRAAVAIRITRPDGVGAVTTYTMRDGKAPKRSLRCFTPVQKRATC